MKINNANVLIGCDSAINLLANSINDNDVSMEYLRDAIDYLEWLTCKDINYSDQLWEYGILLRTTLYHCCELRDSLKTGNYLESRLMNLVDRLNGVFWVQLQINKLSAQIHEVVGNLELND